MTFIPQDKDLPGFHRAFDLAAVRSDLEEALPSLGQVHGCEINRFRYRQGARATFLYEVKTDLGNQWITGTQWPELKAWKLFKKNQGSGFATRTHMLLERFPDDSKMPGVSRVLRGDCPELLKALREVHGPNTQIQLCKPVRYRPHIACVLLLRVSSPARNKELTYYMKFYADDDIATFMRSVNGLSNTDSCAVLRPLLHLPALNAVIWPEVPGTPLTRTILDGDGKRAIAFAASGLRSLHGSQQDLPVAPAADVVKRDAEKHVSFIHHFLPELKSELGSVSKSISRSFDNTVSQPIHHDMKPEHVLINQESCNLIDVEGIALGEPAIDIGNMMARLQAMSWLNGLNSELCESLAIQFADASEPVEPERVAAATALGKLKLATYAISHQINDWHGIATREVRLSVNLLNQVPVSAQRAVA